MTPEEFYKNLKSKKTSDRVFIIGGGPSLNELIPDKTILNRKDIIGVNDAFKIFPNSIANIFADHTWYDWNKDQFHTYNGQLVTSFHFLNEYVAEFEKRNIPIIKDRNMVLGLSTDPKFVQGKNSGHQAINLALHGGWNEIVLCGFDMDQAKAINWHNNHKEPMNPDIFEMSMLPGMQSVADLQTQLNFKVYNINPHSKVTCFEFKPIEDLI